jgi:hypothetical protein
VLFTVEIIKYQVGFLSLFSLFFFLNDYNFFSFFFFQEDE